jgi:hypothetical protein
MTAYIKRMTANDAADTADHSIISANKATALEIHNGVKGSSAEQATTLVRLQTDNQTRMAAIRSRHRANSATQDLLAKCQTTQCPHGPCAEGPIKTRPSIMVCDQLVYVQALCALCDISKAVQKVAKTITCSLCLEPIQDNATDLEGLTEIVHKHAIAVHGNVMPCANLCGYMSDETDVDAFGHWRMCHYNIAHQSPTLRASALRTGVNGTNINLRWYELNKKPEAAVCGACKTTGAECYTVHVEGHAVVLKCQPCTDRTLPTSPVMLIDQHLESSSAFRRIGSEPQQKKGRKLEFPE